MWESGPLGMGRSTAAQFHPLFHANPSAAVKAVLLRFLDDVGDPWPFNGRQQVSLVAVLLDPYIVERSLRLARTSRALPYWESAAQRLPSTAAP